MPHFPIFISKSVAFLTDLLWNSGYKFPWHFWLQVGIPELKHSHLDFKSHSLKVENPPYPGVIHLGSNSHGPGIRSEWFLLVGSIFSP